nr:Dihydrofolate reductase [uncultured bacterium]
MPPKIALIAAVARNGVIGRDGDMPWRIPSDFAWFKRATMGKPMGMGRKQFETFPKPLPGRPHIVVTRQPQYQVEDPEVLVRHNLQEALAAGRRLAEASHLDEVMVIGGGDIYAQAMPVADRLYITHVDLEPEGDVRFPPINPEEWRPSDIIDNPPAASDAASYIIRVYERVEPGAH